MTLANKKHIYKVKTQNSESNNLSVELCSLAFCKWLSFDSRKVEQPVICERVFQLK